MKQGAAFGCIALAATVMGASADAQAEPCYAYEDGAAECVAEFNDTFAEWEEEHGAAAGKRFQKWATRNCNRKGKRRTNKLRATYCVYSAIAHARGVGGPVDLDAADEVLHEACILADLACLDSKQLELTTSPKSSSTEPLKGDVLAKNKVANHKVFSAYRRECATGRADACSKAAVMYDKGKGTDADATKAYRYFWIACDLDRTQCIDIAHAYKEGKKVKRNKKYAKRFRKLAMQREGETGCRYGNTDKCVTNGYAYMDGTHVSRDRAYAMVLFKEACRSGDADGCTGLADCYWSAPKGKKNQKKAANLYEQACKDDSAAACWKLGRLLLRGEKREQDTTRAEQLFKRACDLGDQAGCDYMAKKP